MNEKLVKSEMESTSSICRICMSQEKQFSISIQDYMDGQRISELINLFCGIDVPLEGASDPYPNQICFTCWSILLSAKKLRKTAQESDSFFKNILQQQAKNLECKEEKNEELMVELLEFEDIRDGLVVEEEIEVETKMSYDVELTCSNCDREFKKPYNLKRHLESQVCLKENPRRFLTYCCDMCGRNFRKKSVMVNHILAIHLKQANHKCHHCGKGFFKKWTLKTHMQMVHSDENDRKYECPECQKRFVSEHFLKEHLVCHSGERNFQCEYCCKNYAYKTDLRRHLQTHTGQYSYRCEICNKGFIKKSDLTAHQNRKTNCPKVPKTKKMPAKKREKLSLQIGLC